MAAFTENKLPHYTDNWCKSSSEPAGYALNRLEKPMIADLKQPAKNWIADHLENFQALIDSGDDPSCTISYEGIEIEIRLNKCPGVFEREAVKVEGA